MADRAGHAGRVELWPLVPVPDTVDALLLSVGYFGLYLLVLVTCAGHADRLSTLLLALVVSGFAQALYGGLMTLSGLEYGFFAEKVHYRDVATGTFVNRNHLAGYLGLTLAAGVATLMLSVNPALSPAQLVDRMRAGLMKSGSNSEIVVFPNVDHGFNADYRPTYDKRAATYAQQLASDWLKDHGV